MIDKTAKYSDIHGQTRDQVISTLGEPKETIDDGGGNITDTYIVEGRVYDSSAQFGKRMGFAMTLGLVEFVYFPVSVWETASEAVCPSPKKLIIRYENGKCFWQTTKKIDASH